MTVTPPTDLPRLGEAAPAFEAESTLGGIELGDFKGHWLVLFSYPADFAPICTTEIVAFARRAPDFERLDARLVGLSTDSIHAHRAWLRNLERDYEVTIGFPVIADPEMQMARQYGLIHPETAAAVTVRAVFVIDPGQILRAMLVYPLSNARDVGEILRLLAALRTTDSTGRSTPEGWRPGDPVLVKPPPRAPVVDPGSAGPEGTQPGAPGPQARDRRR